MFLFFISIEYASISRVGVSSSVEGRWRKTWSFFSTFFPASLFPLPSTAISSVWYAFFQIANPSTRRRRAIRSVFFIETRWRLLVVVSENISFFWWEPNQSQRLIRWAWTFYFHERFFLVFFLFHSPRGFV